MKKYLKYLFYIVIPIIAVFLCRILKVAQGEKKLQYIVEETVKELGIKANIEIIGDMQQIMALGIMRTPALIIDDKVVVQGRVPKKDEIKKLFQK